MNGDGHVLTAAQMRGLDARTIGGLGLPGVVLMERAALGVVDAITARRPQPGRVVALAGPGNNGGDAWAVARLLSLRGWDVTVVSTAGPERLGDDARIMHDAALRCGVSVVSVNDAAAPLRSADVIVDGLLGIGVTSAPRGEPLQLLEQVNDALAAQPRRALVAAIDLPTGVMADTGATPGAVLVANVTIACGARKWGHVLPRGVDACGEVQVADIGIPPAWIDETDGVATVYGLRSARRDHVAVRPGDHKGSRGRVLVIAGSDAMPGAAAIAARAAVRAGAGLVGVAAPPAARALALGLTPELVGVDPTGLTQGIGDTWDSVVIGPGLGVDERSVALLRATLGSIDSRPLVVDADALTLLARSEPRSLPPGTIVTPHPGELARLLHIDNDAVLADLPGAARQAHARWGCVVIAKTAGAIIVDETVRFVEPGHPGMASAGMGDALSGIVAACGTRMPTSAAAAHGAWLHARAGAAAGRRYGAEALTATDVVEALGDAFALLAEPAA